LLLQMRAAGIDLWIERGQLRYRMPRTEAAADALAQIRLHKAQIEAALKQPAPSFGKSFEASARQTLALAQTGTHFFPMRVEQIWRAELARSGRAPKIPFDIPYAKWLGDTLDIEILRQSIRIAVRRHDALHSKLAVVDGRPVQAIQDAELVDLRVEAIGGTDRDAALQQAMAALGRPAIDLASETGFRCRIFRHDGGGVALGVVWHHYFCDHWSVKLLLQEVEACYRALASGETPPLAEIQNQYGDYAARQRLSLSRGLEDNLNHWRQVLADAPAARLPYDHRHDTRNMAPLHFHIAGEVAWRLKSRARALRIGFFSMLFSAYQLALARWSGADCVTGAVSVADRFDAQFSATLGYLITALAISSPIDRAMTADCFTQAVSRRLADAYSYRNLSYELYEAIFSPPRPFCPTLFNFIALESLAADQGQPETGLRLSAGPPFPRKPHHRELYFELVEFSRGLRGRIFYNTDFFTAETVEKFIRHYAAILERMAAHPETKIGELP
jgi:hypothetical protein